MPDVHLAKDGVTHIALLLPREHVRVCFEHLMLLLIFDTAPPVHSKPIFLCELISLIPKAPAIRDAVNKAGP